MTDRELLELAAKAAGFRLEWDGPPDKWCPVYYEGKTYHAWTPITDDGDTLRLAVKLRFGIKDIAPTDCDDIQPVGMIEVWKEDHSDPIYVEWYKPGDDRYAATRRAIVRAAAEIGKSMEHSNE